MKRNGRPDEPSCAIDMGSPRVSVENTAGDMIDEYCVHGGF